MLQSTPSPDSKELRSASLAARLCVSRIGGRRVLWAAAPGRCGAAQGEVERSPVPDARPGQPETGGRASVDLEALDVGLGVGGLWRVDSKNVPSRQVNSHRAEERAADHKATHRRDFWVEPDRREDVPRRGLPAVVVPWQSAG